MWIIPILIIVMISIWFIQRDVLPKQIRIASAYSNGLYYKFATILKEPLEDISNRPVDVMETRGSVSNCELLLKKQADVAIMQAGSISMEGIAGLVPLYPDVVHVVVRKKSRIKTILDLNGKNLIVGPKGSGMRHSAKCLLKHYNINAKRLSETAFFPDLQQDDSWDGAIITTGLLNPGLKDILSSGEFELVSIEDARALSIHHRYFSSYTIPRGMFSEGPAVPREDIHTIATTAFLAVREDASDLLVSKVLDAIYQNDLSADDKLPTLMSYNDAYQWQVYPMHMASKQYFNPYQGVDTLANIIDSISNTYQLIVAFGAGLFLLWKRRNYLIDRLLEKEKQEQKDELDRLLQLTFEIERNQMDERDPVILEKYLDQVTETKLVALEELTSEKLQDDRKFIIFITQCANLTRKIQAKIAIYR